MPLPSQPIFSLKISLLRTFEDGIPAEARQLVRAAAQAG